MKELLIKYLNDCLKDAESAPDYKTKHHYFDMAFGVADFVMFTVDDENWKEYKEIWEEYHEKFYDLGCLGG